MFRKLSLPAVAILLFLWLGLGSWWYGHNYCGMNGTAGVPGLSIVDGNYEISAAETFSFYKSSADPIVPPSTIEALETLAFHLIDEPDKRLKLYGIYSPVESNTSGADNLGLARAQAIRGRLIDLGVSPANISARGIRFQNASFADGLMYGGVFFNVVNINEKPSREQGIEKSNPTDLFQPVNIYFDPNEYDIILTDELQIYLEQIKTFLLGNKQARIAIIGHTDNDGNEQANLNLSETRARNVKKFMIRSGFDPKRLIIEYNGEGKPIMPNDVDDSKHKNRRVELRLRVP